MGGKTMKKTNKLLTKQELLRLIKALEKRLYEVEERTRKEAANAKDDRNSIRSLIDECHKQALQHTTKMYAIHEREEHQKPTEEEKLEERLSNLAPRINAALDLYGRSLGKNHKKDENTYDLLCDITAVLNDFAAYLCRKKPSDDFNFSDDS